ncbi:MAG TPA: type II toxin-antitoxin system VapC family toxin [Thermoanaerobaculia bacterium]|nr:type II toxin-antitoxin system VapC family toxin [Thermoanaerobaculia bacterium]
MSYLVDTNVVSELRKNRRCNPGVAAWFAGVSSEEIYLSVLTVGELRKGIESIRRRDEAAAKALEAWLQELVFAYSDRFLPVDQVIAEQWGRFSVPDPLPVFDALLAATAKVHGLTLVTRNLKHVERTGVDCMSPFST